MTAQGSEYSHARHMSQVQAAAREAGLKGAAFNVLAYLCGAANFRKPIVRVSKAKIEEKTRYCDKTIKQALAALRAAGFIEAVAYAEGGRGYCPVYVIRTTKGGENFPPLDEADIAKGGKKLPVKGGKNFPKRGEETSPPSGNLSIYPSEGRRAASSGGGFRPLLDAGQGASTQGATDDKRPERDALEVSEYKRACEVHPNSPIKALDLAAKWKAERLGHAGEIA